MYIYRVCVYIHVYIYIHYIYIYTHTHTHNAMNFLYGSVFNLKMAFIAETCR